LAPTLYLLALFIFFSTWHNVSQVFGDVSMRKRAISMIEVIISMTLVASCFAFTYQLLGYAKKKTQRQELKIERSLEHAALRSALVETLGQAEMMHFVDLPKLISENRGIEFMYKNFADLNPKLCGSVHGAVALNMNTRNLELRLFELNKRPLNPDKPDKRIVLFRNVESWSIEELNLNRSLQWQPKMLATIKVPNQALRLTIISKGEEFSFVINFINDAPLNLSQTEKSQNVH